MIGLVLVTHGRLAEEFVRALEHVVGPQKNIVAVCVDADDEVERCRRDVVKATEEVDDGHGVILLTDMFGGTPSNLAISALDHMNVEVLAGINLPMLIKLASVRDSNNIQAAADSAQEAGRKYINIASRLLEGKA
jgi:PTS system mannose-specific IIA component